MHNLSGSSQSTNKYQVAQVQGQLEQALQQVTQADNTRSAFPNARRN